MNTPNPPKNVLLESERKALFGRVTVYIGDLFKRMTSKNANPKWNGSEIARHYGLERSNVTMFQNYEKYGREISPSEIENLLLGELITVKDLKDNCAENDKERNLIDERFKLVKLNKIAEKHGVDAVKVLEEYLLKQGVDVNEE